MKRPVHKWTLGAVATALLLGGYGRQLGAEGMKPWKDSGKLNVVTTLFPYYDFARWIAGDDVELTMVIPAGTDSHSFGPTPADTLTIQNADVLISNGGEMRQWLAQVLDAADTSYMAVVFLMDYVGALEEEHMEGMEDASHEGYDHVTASDHEAEEAHDYEAKEAHDHVINSLTDDDGHQVEIEYDEHIWTSPVNAMRLMGIIADTLMETGEAHREVYQANRDAYLQQLSTLHGQFLDAVKHEKRNMIIVGDKFPFRHLADGYDLRYRAAFSGCSADTEPSAKTIAYLIDKIKEEQIPAVCYLELSSHRVSEITSEETGAEPLLFRSCYNVTCAQFDNDVTYLELMKSNVENLRKGLGE